MSDVLIGSIISGAVAVIVALIANITTRKKDAIANAVRDQKIEDKLQALTDRVDSHNNAMDKMTEMWSDMKATKTDVEWLKRQHNK